MAGTHIGVFKKIKAFLSFIVVESKLLYDSEKPITDARQIPDWGQVDGAIQAAMDGHNSNALQVDGSNQMESDIHANGYSLLELQGITDSDEIPAIDIFSRLLKDSAGANFVDFSLLTQGLGLKNAAGFWTFFLGLAASSNKTITLQNKTYTVAGLDDIATAIVGVYKDQGNFTPSGSYPTSANTLLGDTPQVGYTWTIAGLGLGITATMGGITVSDRDVVRVIVSPPGQTDANWSAVERNLEYVPENVANKDTDGLLAANSDAKYASQKAVKTYADALVLASAIYGKVLAGWTSGAGTVANGDTLQQVLQKLNGNTALKKPLPEYLATYTIGSLLIDKDYVLANYTISSDVLLGFNLTGAAVGSCLYLKITANGTNKITFDNSTVSALTGISNKQVLEAGLYTLLGVYNGSKVDISVIAVDDVVNEVNIPTSGLEVFFDLKNTDTLILDGTNIVQVNNIANPDYFLSQATGANQPAHDATEGAVFDGTADYFNSNVPSTLMTTTNNYTIFVTYRNYTPSPSNRLMTLYENSSSVSGFHMAQLQSAVLKQGFYKASPGYVTKSTASAASTKHVSFCENAAGVVSLELDGVAAGGVVTIATGSGITTNLQVGASGDTKSSFFQGSVEKIIIYNRVLTGPEKATVVSYLNT